MFKRSYTFDAGEQQPVRIATYFGVGESV